MASGWTTFGSDKDIRVTVSASTLSASNSVTSNQSNIGNDTNRADVSKPLTDRKEYSQSVNPTAKRPAAVDVCVFPCSSAATSSATDDIQCISLPAGALGAREKQWPSLTATALFDKSYNKCSSSCENLDIGKTQPCEHFAPHPRLCKASSDNPIYGVAAPPIPPRDYVPGIDKPSPRPRAEIHPILQDGEQRSSTHYWLLPDKQRVPPSQGNKQPELYMNVPHPTSPPSSAAVSREVGGGRGGRCGPADVRNEPSRSGSKKGVHDWCNSTVPLLADEADMDTASVDLPYGECFTGKVPESSSEPDHQHHHKSLPVGHHSDYELEQPTTMTSMSEAKGMIEQVRGVVADVSEDEACTALSTHRWNVSEAVKYIKVEHLFRLALASRQTCQSLLEKYGWNLEMAASALVDLPCSKSSSSSTVGGQASVKMMTNQNREQSPKLQNVVTTKESKPSTATVTSTSRDLNMKQPLSVANVVHDHQQQNQCENNPAVRDVQNLSLPSKQPLNVIELKTTTTTLTNREHCPVSRASTATQRDHQTKQ